MPQLARLAHRSCLRFLQCDAQADAAFYKDIRLEAYHRRLERPKIDRNVRPPGPESGPSTAQLEPHGLRRGARVGRFGAIRARERTMHAAVTEPALR
jgi:hypothetical protein